MLPLNTIFGSDPRTRRIGVVCVLLLLASAVNYMDRQTLSVVAKRIKEEFQIDNVQYGQVEAIFGYSFAFGSLFWGYIVDRFSVRWVYPIGLLGWSAMGFLTGWVRSFDELYWCRLLLGFFESAHWPCGLKTTQALLSRSGRAMGNSVLQSGTSLGAILTPLVMLAILTPEPGSWRFGFQLIAVVGASWVFLWLSVVRDRDFRDASNVPSEAKFGSEAGRVGKWWDDVFTSQFMIILLMIICINTMWQVVRAWLPLIMQESYGFSERQTLLFNSLWYMCTDIGCFSAGLLTMVLARKGWDIKTSRVTALSICVLMFSTIIAVPFLNHRIAAERSLSAASQAGDLESTTGGFESTAGGFESTAGENIESEEKGSTPSEASEAPPPLSWSEEFQAILALRPLQLAMLGILLISGAGALGIFPIYYSFAQDVSQHHQGKVTSLSALGGWLVSSAAQPGFGWLKENTGSYDIGIWIISILPVLPLIALACFWQTKQPSHSV
jgi:MFS family permease